MDGTRAAASDAIKAVAEEGSFGRAANLGYTQSAVSQQIAVLSGSSGSVLSTRPRPQADLLTEAGRPAHPRRRITAPPAAQAD
jgi:DNA-binding transcriptional LysR family regulator